MHIGSPAAWNVTLSILQPPEPPRFAWPSPTAEQSTPPSSAPASEPAAEKTTSSIGLSPVVQAFLLRLQELGMTHVSGSMEMLSVLGVSLVRLTALKLSRRRLFGERHHRMRNRNI